MFQSPPRVMFCPFAARVPAVMVTSPLNPKVSSRVSVPPVVFEMFPTSFAALVRFPVPVDTRVVSVPAVNPPATRVAVTEKLTVRPAVACPEASKDAPAAVSFRLVQLRLLSPVTRTPAAPIVMFPVTVRASF